MIRTILIVTFLFSALFSYSADPFEEVLRIISENNPELRHSLVELQAMKAENSTDLSPADPRVELGYLWNSERDGGNRKDISVTQELDFPTVYARRRGLSRASDALAEAQQRHAAVEILRRARILLIDITYYNALHDILEQRLQYAVTIKDNSRRALDQGEITIIDFNKAALDHALCLGELQRTNLELERLNMELTVMNGNAPVPFDNKDFPAVILDSDTADLISAATSPELDILRGDLGKSGAEESLARSSWIPKFSLGYSSEFQNGNSLQGAVLGISVPLWENRNRVKAARLRSMSSSMELDNMTRALTAEYGNLIRQIHELQRIEASYAEALRCYDSDALTLEAFNAGQITILEYANQMQYTQELRCNLLDTRRQIATLHTRLMVPSF